MLNNVTDIKGQLLLEFFTEEIPARFQSESENQLEVLMKNILNLQNYMYPKYKMPRTRFELVTRGSSIHCSTN